MGVVPEQAGAQKKGLPLRRLGARPGRELEEEAKERGRVGGNFIEPRGSASRVQPPGDGRGEN